MAWSMHVDPYPGNGVAVTAGCLPGSRARGASLARRLLVATLVVTVSATASAAPPSPAMPPSAQPSAPARWSQLRFTSFQHWWTENGLPHPIVTALAQDRTGFLWI